MAELDVWTVYRGTERSPNEYVVRRWVAGEGGVRQKSEGWRGATLAEVREPLIERGLYQLDRQSGDDATIVETWF